MTATTEEASVAKGKDSGGPLRCSFCGKSQHDVQKLIAGPGVYICDECVGLCDEILEKESGERFFGDELAERSEKELFELVDAINRSHEGIDRTIARVVRELRNREVSWARIGEALGMTRQSAWERFSGEE